MQLGRRENLSKLESRALRGRENSRTLDSRPLRGRESLRKLDSRSLRGRQHFRKLGSRRLRGAEFSRLGYCSQALGDTVHSKGLFEETTRRNRSMQRPQHHRTLFAFTRCYLRTRMDILGLTLVYNLFSSLYIYIHMTAIKCSCAHLQDKR
jgi:hypothetical protein